MITFEKAIDNIYKNNCKNVYALYAKDHYSVKNFLESLKSLVVMPELNISHINAHKIEDFNQLSSLIETLPLMSDKRILIIDEADFLSDKTKSDPLKIINNICKYNIPSYAIIVFIYYIKDKRENIKKNKKASKLEKISAEILYTDKISLKEATNKINLWVSNKNKTISNDAIYELYNRCFNLDELYNETQKLCAYSEASISKNDVEVLVASSNEDDVFDLTNQISLKNAIKATEIMNNLYFKGENPVSIFYLLQGQFKKLYFAKLYAEKGFNSSQIAKELGVHPYVGKLLSTQCNNFSKEQLQNNMLLCGSTEKELLSYGDKKIKLEQFILKTLL